MFTSTDLKATITLIRPIIERQLDDAEVIAGHREQVTAQGGDWSQVKALVKAMIQDECDEAGGHKRVMAILHKADNALGYADMIGLGNLNEKNSFGDLPPHDHDTGEIIEISDEPQQASATSERPNLAEQADELDTAGDDQGEQKVTPEPAAADEATLTPVKAGQASQQGEGGGEDAPASLADTESTAARKDVHHAGALAETPQPSDEGTESGSGSTRPGGEQAGTQAPPVDTHSEPGNGQSGVKPLMAPRQAGEASSDASPVAANHNFTRIPVLGEVR